MSYFRTMRGIELSTIKYIEDSINSAWTGITIVKAFFQAYDKPVPVIAVRLLETMSTREEVGSTDLANTHSIVIDIFAKSDGQRLDLVDYLMGVLKGCWPLYTISHTSGDSESLDYVNSGTMIRMIRIVNNTKIEPGANVEIHDKFRHVINLQVAVK